MIMLQQHEVVFQMQRVFLISPVINSVAVLKQIITYAGGKNFSSRELGLDGVVTFTRTNPSKVIVRKKKVFLIKFTNNPQHTVTYTGWNF